MQDHQDALLLLGLGSQLWPYMITKEVGWEWPLIQERRLILEAREGLRLGIKENRSFPLPEV